MTRSLYLVILVGLAACGGDDNSNVSIGDVPGTLIDSLCSLGVQCDQVKDLSTCKSSFQTMSSAVETLVADVKAGIITYDPAKFSACLDEDQSRGCAFNGFHNTQNDPCDGYLTGTVATGGACFYANECVSGICNATSSGCDASTACCPGTCGTLTSADVTLGGACTVYDRCIDSYCEGASATSAGTCTALVATAGAACDALDACAGTMFCNETSSTGGTCYQPGSEGGTCDPTFNSFVDLECLDARDYCDATTSKCVARVAVGGTCSSTILCEGLASCVNAKCAASLVLGDACDPMNGPYCIDNLSCVNSVCVLSTSGPSCRP
jgi:hypothetical protein